MAIAARVTLTVVVTMGARRSRRVPPLGHDAWPLGDVFSARWSAGVIVATAATEVASGDVELAGVMPVVGVRLQGSLRLGLLLGRGQVGQAVGEASARAPPSFYW